MMKYFFPDGEIDLSNSRIQRRQRQYKLKGKAVALLQYLIEHSGQLVSKDTLFRAVWPGIAVGEEALHSCLRELRVALGDDVKNPRFIETVYRRGYRWIAPLSLTPLVSECGVTSHEPQIFHLAID